MKRLVLLLCASGFMAAALAGDPMTIEFVGEEEAQRLIFDLKIG